MTAPAEVLAWLAAEGSPEVAAGNARFGLPTDVYGVPVGAMRAKAKAIGTDHDLARALWTEGGHEPRMMAVFLADPERLSRAEADAWTAGFDTWAICDTACFHLYDRTDWRWEPIDAWAADAREYVRRAAFALLWALAVHDKRAPDDRFTRHFDLFRTHATDGRIYVKKALDMALRAIGKRRPALNAAATELAEELAARDDPTARWIGRHAARELTSDKLRARLADQPAR